MLAKILGSVGIGSADYDGTAYGAGEWAGFVGGFFTGGAYAKGVATCTAKAGTAKGFLRALWRGGCFVAGTKVTLSEMPRSGELEHSLWAGDSIPQPESVAEFWNNSPRGPYSRTPLTFHPEPTAIAEGLEPFNSASRTDSQPWADVPDVGQAEQHASPAPTSRLQIPIEDVPLGARGPTKGAN